MDDKRRRRQEEKQRQRRRKLFCNKVILCFLIVILLCVMISLVKKGTEGDSSNGKMCSSIVGVDETENGISKPASGQNESDEVLDETMQKLTNFAEKNHFSMKEYPEELVELLRKNVETEEFVLNYPLKKDVVSIEPLTELLYEDEIPLLMQWDERWGYYIYGSNVMGLTGCGPTCLSMVASFLLKDASLTPLYMAKYAVENGYCVAGSGTSWDFMSNGAESLGLHAKEVPLHENTVKQYLLEGKPIICIMGKGIFTDKGHFLVFSGWKDGKIEIKDPNSRKNSEKLWEFEEISGQIKNMWVYTV